MMRRIGIAIAACVLPVGVLYVGLPGNELPAHGPADPLLGLRARVVGVLRAVGAMRDAGPFLSDAWLPCGSGSEISDAQDRVEWRLDMLREPVYRGLLLSVGDRITVTVELGDGCELGRALRIWYERDGAREVVAIATPETGGIAEDRKRGAVTGFVPRGVDAFGYEEILNDGTNRGGSSWSFR